MKKSIPVLVSALLASGVAFAQTTTPSEPSQSPTTPPATRPATPPAPAERMAPPATKPDSTAMTMTDDQIRKWVGKPVYSSDNRNLGEVASFERDPSGKILEMHADIGGFLGIGETRVRVLPDQFKLQDDRVVLSVKGDEAKALPHVKK